MRRPRPEKLPPNGRRAGCQRDAPDRGRPGFPSRCCYYYQLRFPARLGCGCLFRSFMPAVRHEYARLAGLTKHQNVRDQLLDLARGWTAIAQHERAPFYASHHFTKIATTKRDRKPQAVVALAKTAPRCS